MAPRDGGLAFAGAILTGGRSSRMGRDKATLEVDGLAMASRVAAALTGAGAAPVVAVGGDGAALVALGLGWMPDRYPGQGPLGGILTAFTALTDHDVVAVVATDLPDLTAAAVSALVDGLGEHAVALAGREQAEPLCAVWRVARCLPHLQAAFSGGERAVHRAMAELDQVVVPVSAQDVRNVNQPDDLAR
jgi:molybdopterin-guanine dinucleotide biosynthesis protein A